MWGAIASLLNGLVSVVSKALLGFWLVKAGKEKQELSEYKEESKKIEKSKSIAQGIRNMPDDKLRKLLRDPSNKDE